MPNRKLSELVFFDTSAFVPLLDSGHNLNARIVQHLKNINALVTIDAVVLSEFLAGVSDSVNKDDLVEKYTKQFRVSPFDIVASKVCAELFRVLKTKGQLPRSSTNRQITKVDIMIMSSAIVCRAKEFVFEDRHFENYPQFLPTDICGFSIPTFVRVSKLPDVFIQQELIGLQRSVEEVGQREKLT